MKKYLIIGCLALVFMLSSQKAAMAVAEMEILVDKLVEKGILTPAEGDKILRETKEEAKKQREETKKAVAKEIIPDWLSKTKLYGDFRLRYQNVDVQDQRSQSQGRFRVRLNLDIAIAEKVKFIFGLASGGNDPRSANQSFGNDWDKKQININYAYVDYTPFTWLKLSGGKMANPVYTVSQLIWDEDINPEGVATQIAYPINPCFSLLLNSGAFVLQDNKNNTPTDPWMWVIQPGFSWKAETGLQAKFAAGYTSFENFQNQPQQKYSSGTNSYYSTDGTNKLYRYKYNLATMTGELGYKNPISGFPAIRYAGLFGEYTNNVSASNGKSGYLTGLTFGDEKVVEKAQWNFKGSWRRLEKNAVPDILPDSDFYFGDTGVSGYMLQFRYGLLKNINFTSTYFRAEQISGPGKPENLIQTDLNFKF
jgi:polyhydroxyalkanoate synthesis regulator phasin